jgi:hypothetical protein
MRAMIGLLQGLPNAKGRKDDDFGDRLNYRYTVSILTLFAMIVTSKQYVGTKITCWVPAHFDGSWSSYTDDYCWVKNTYYLPLDENIPKETEEKSIPHLTFYQWVPLILLIQAFLFYGPCLVWRTFNDKSGIDVDSVVQTAKSFHQAEKVNDKLKTLEYLRRQMHRFLTMRQDKNIGCNLSLSYFITKFCCPKCGRRHGNYLITLYLFVKVLYIANVIGQLFMLNHLLGTDFHYYGLDALIMWSQGQDISETERFPRVTMCDFKVRFTPGNIQRYTVQCVLPINLFHEKIYLIIWFWMVFLAAYNVGSLVSWALHSIFRIDQHRFVKRHMRIADRKIVKKDKNMLIRFVDKYLGSDGVFVLRLIQTNTDDIATADIAAELWDEFRKNELMEISPTSDLTGSTSV